MNNTMKSEEVYCKLNSVSQISNKESIMKMFIEDIEDINQKDEVLYIY